jgi:hypothetical protein
MQTTSEILEATEEINRIQWKKGEAVVSVRLFFKMKSILVAMLGWRHFSFSGWARHTGIRCPLAGGDISSTRAGVKMIQEYYRQMRKFGCNILAVVQQYDIIKESRSVVR